MLRSATRDRGVLTLYPETFCLPPGRRLRLGVDFDGGGLAFRHDFDGGGLAFRYDFDGGGLAFRYDFDGGGLAFRYDFDGGRLAFRYDFDGGGLAFRFDCGDGWQPFGPRLASTIVSDEHAVEPDGDQLGALGFTGACVGLWVWDLTGQGHPADFTTADTQPSADLTPNICRKRIPDPGA